MAQTCYYEVLGIERGADGAAIKSAFRKRAMQYHPDRTQGDPEAEKKFKELGQAYEVLSDEQKRAAYDRFGHAAGDAALKQVCDILVSQVRQTDIIGRLGGDEFGIILTHAELADAREKADAFAHRIDRMSVSGADPADAPVRLGASCGVITWSGQASADRLIAEADEAMFRAKAARKSAST